MRSVVGPLRVAIAGLVIVAVAATYATARMPVNPFDFFGFFTIQSNLLAAAAELVAAVALLRRRRSSALLRAAATTYITLTGIVYNTLLAGLAGGVALPWANQALHTWVPALVLLDWVLIADRPPLPWQRLWVVAPYPLLWLVVILARGATDGWVPYPFLNPRLGYTVVAAYSAGITGAVLLIAVLVWATSRLRLLAVRRDAAPDERVLQKHPPRTRGANPGQH